jgi:hypothetical protein
MSTRLMLKDVRLAYGHGLWTKSKPPKADASAKEKYRVAFILPKTHKQLPEIRKAIMEEMTAKFGARAAAVLKLAEAGQKSCLRDGDTKEGEGFEGNMFIAANSETRPSVFDGMRNPVTSDDGIVYSGCYVNASIDIYAFDNVSKGNSAGLRGVQFLRKGDAFGGGAPADESEFDEIGVAEEGGDDLTA